MTSSFQRMEKNGAIVYGFFLHGNYIVLDVQSGSVHVVSEAAFQAIKNWNFLEESEQASSFSANIKELISRKKLFSPEFPLPNPKNFPIVKALCLHMADSCNFACTYCFAKAGDLDAALMPFEIGRRALDFLLETSGDRTNLEVDFFGGEPLLNFPVIQDLVAYARSQEAAFRKKFRFTLTTNGLLLDDEVTEFCNREISNVVLSLDGRKSVHDFFRKTKQNQGSYDLIVPKFQRFVHLRGARDYYIRGTFTHNNLDFAQDLYEMERFGFHSLALEPVVCAPEEPYAFTQEDLPLLLREYENLALELSRRRGTDHDFSFYHYSLDLRHGPCLHKRLAGCGRGTEYLAVTPTGDFFPCHQFTHDPEFRMGSVFEGITRPDLQENFSNCRLQNKPACRDCWAKYYCAGGCAANAQHASGSIFGVDELQCTLFKKRIECAITLQVLSK